MDQRIMKEGAEKIMGGLQPSSPRWTYREWTGRLARQNRSNTPLCPCSSPLAPVIVKVRHTRYSTC